MQKDVKKKKPDPLDIRIGHRIKQEVRRNHYKNADMCRILNYENESQISPIYSGQIHVSLDRIKALAKEWNVREEYLLCIDNFRTEADRLISLLHSHDDQIDAYMNFVHILEYLRYKIFILDPLYLSGALESDSSNSLEGIKNALSAYDDIDGFRLIRIVSPTGVCKILSINEMKRFFNLITKQCNFIFDECIKNINIGKDETPSFMSFALAGRLMAIEGWDEGLEDLKHALEEMKTDNRPDDKQSSKINLLDVMPRLSDYPEFCEPDQSQNEEN